MAKTQSIFRGLLSASFLLVLVFGLLFMYTNASSIYGPLADLGQQKFLLYLLLLLGSSVVGFVLAPEVMRGLGRAPYWRSFAFRFLPSAILSFVILLLFSGVFLSSNTINPIKILGNVPILTLLFQALVVAQIEEISFRGILFNSLRHNKRTSTRNAYIISAIAFAVFHLAVSNSYLVMLTYIPLSLIWTYLSQEGYPFFNRIPKIKQFFEASPQTQQSNAGSHFAWNAFILGFIRPGAI